MNKKHYAFFLKKNRPRNKAAQQLSDGRYQPRVVKSKKVYDRKKVKAEFRKNKCLVVTEGTGYDELYILAGGNMEVSDSLMATPSEDAKKGEIKRLFAGSLKTNKSSRVVLNKFISKIA